MFQIMSKRITKALIKIPQIKDRKLISIFKDLNGNHPVTLHSKLIVELINWTTVPLEQVRWIEQETIWHHFLNCWNNLAKLLYCEFKICYLKKLKWSAKVFCIIHCESIMFKHWTVTGMSIKNYDTRGGEVIWG